MKAAFVDQDAASNDDSPTLVHARTATGRGRGAPAEERLWDTHDVAAYLKVSRSWVYHRSEAGLLPHLRGGGLLRFDPEAIRTFARKR